VSPTPIGFYSWLGSIPDVQAWEAVYPALFRLLEKEFSSVLSLHFLAWERAKDSMSKEKMNEVMGPWECLARDREWKLLQFCVPLDWQPAMKPRAET